MGGRYVTQLNLIIFVEENNFITISFVTKSQEGQTNFFITNYIIYIISYLMFNSYLHIYDSMIKETAAMKINQKQEN